MKVRNKLRSYLDLCAVVTLAAILSSQVVPTYAQRALKGAKTTEIEINKDPLEVETTGCTDGHINFTTGGDSTSETYGNIRTYSGGGVNVKARAWSRTKDTGTWQTAYLGQYGSAGLGVTDRAEDGGDPSHKVDSDGLINYVLFAFDQPVSVDMVQLESVTTDSDISVWIGNAANPYTSALTMSDALLAGFANETNSTSATTSRDADINAGSAVGNVLVVAARVDQSNDYFKIANIDKDCASTRVTFIKEVQTANQINGSTQAFAFTATGMTPTNFSLVDNNVVGPDRISVAVSPSTTVSATEAITLGWTLSDLSCTGTAAGNINVNFAARKVSVTPQSGQSVVCTFKNLQLGASAAKVKLSGRATLMDSRGVSGAIVTLQDLSTGAVRSVTTNTFGYYSISDVEVGGFYMLSIAHRRYRFAESSRFFSLEDELTGLDFVGGF
ncbi:MAG: carboxypeptidase-like regulatory domain-containing protein [Pyrinomonadaceae bacterium]